MILYYVEVFPYIFIYSSSLNIKITVLLSQAENEKFES